MIPVLSKFFLVTPPAAIVDNASLTCNALDTLGFRYARYLVVFGAMDIAVTALKLQESDTLTNGTTLASAADITGAIFGTSNNDTGAASTLPSATADNLIFSFELDLRGRKRYLNPVATMGDGAAGTYVTILAELMRGEKVPTTAAQKGISQNLRVPAL